MYIAEAHTTDGWQMQSNLDEDVLLANHRTLDERFAAARQSTERLGLTMPVLVDGMDDAVSEAFAAWPERIYVIGVGGTVLYKGGMGPFGFDTDEAENRLAEIIGSAG